MYVSSFSCAPVASIVAQRTDVSRCSYTVDYSLSHVHVVSRNSNCYTQQKRDIHTMLIGPGAKAVGQH